MLRHFLLTGMIVLGLAGQGFAESRIALIIGNGAYSDIGPLENAGNDSELIANTLEDVGFEVILVRDANQRSMKKAIIDFGRRLRSAGPDTAGLFYYAGHGIQARERNYLMPIEARPQDSADLDLMGVEVNWVLAQMESAGNRTNIIVLDACRNNPFAASDRSINRGLARIEPPTGSFVAYATAPGAVAADGDGVNSPFTLALAAAISEPDLAIEQVFKRVRVEVIKSTNGLQTPWDSSSLVDDFYFITDTPVPDVDPAELSLWQGVSESGDPNRVALFLQVFPNSHFAPKARALLRELMMDAPATAERSVPVEEQPVDPDLTENELIAIAQATPSVQAYANYLAAFPDGIYADLAKAELSNLLAGAAPSPLPAVGAVPETVETQEEQVAAIAPSGPMTFEQPLTEGDPVVLGWSIEELAKGSPRFPPIEGLPTELWSDRKCSGCHNWNRKNLCDQGSFYVGKEEEALGRIPHPYGGSFKFALSQWAEQGCN